MKNTLLIILFMISCQTQDRQSEDLKYHYPNIIFYEIFLQSYADSNGDGVGDIKGLISKLDYLEELGIEGIWLMPVHPSPTYHKYDITDYYSVHSDYGTIEDFKNLVDAAHKRNIRIIIDLVVNHTSSYHPWFINFSKKKINKYRDYYVWTSDKELISKEPHHWHKVNDSAGSIIDNEKYYGFFWHEMPDLNFDNRDVRKEIINIGKFWLGEIGIDGFRLDAVRFIFPEEKVEKNYLWWQEFRMEMQKVKPDFFMVGEIWGEDIIVAPFLEKGIHAGFNFDLSFAIIKTIKEETDSGIVEQLIQTRELYLECEPGFYDAIFLTNHDQNRVMSEFNGDIRKAKVAASLLLTLPGIPFIYYGEELGMTGEKPDEFIREPFPWDYNTKDSCQTTWEEPEYSIQENVPSLNEQRADKLSLFNHYKKLIKLRKSYKSLRYGDILPATVKNPGLISYYRNFEDETLLILHNISKNEIKISLPEKASSLKKVILTSLSAEIQPENNKITIPPFTSIIISAGP